MDGVEGRTTTRLLFALSASLFSLPLTLARPRPAASSTIDDDLIFASLSTPLSPSTPSDTSPLSPSRPISGFAATTVIAQHSPSLSLAAPFSLLRCFLVLSFTLTFPWQPLRDSPSPPGRAPIPPPGQSRCPAFLSSILAAECAHSFAATLVARPCRRPPGSAWSGPRSSPTYSPGPANARLPNGNQPGAFPPLQNGTRPGPADANHARILSQISGLTVRASYSDPLTPRRMPRARGGGDCEAD